jgi:hypothetical protein
VRATSAEFVAFEQVQPDLDFTRRETDTLRDWQARTRIGAGVRVLRNGVFAFLVDVSRECASLLRDRPADVVLFDWMLGGAGVLPRGRACPQPRSCTAPIRSPCPACHHRARAWLRDRAGCDQPAIRVIAHAEFRVLASGLSLLNTARAEQGLAPFDRFDQQLLSSNAVYVLTAPELDFASTGRLPANVEYVGPAFEPYPRDWNSPWPSTNTDPLVVISLSTSYMDQRALAQRILDAIDGLSVRALLTVGPALDTTGLRLPANTCSVAFVPHRSVFPHAALAISHAGWQTINAPLADLRSINDPTGWHASSAQPGDGLSPARRRVLRSAAGPVIPDFQIGQRVDRVPTGGPPAADPDLEVKVGAGGVTGLADLADRLASAHGLPGADGERAGLAVGEEEVEPINRVLGRIPAGPARLVASGDDRARQRREHRGAFACEHVLALVHVAWATRAEAVGGVAEAMRPRHREHGAFARRLGRARDAGFRRGWQRRYNGGRRRYLGLPRLGFRLGSHAWTARRVSGLATRRLARCLGLGRRHAVFAAAGPFPRRRGGATRPTHICSGARGDRGTPRPCGARRTCARSRRGCAPGRAGSAGSGNRRRAERRAEQHGQLGLCGCLPGMPHALIFDRTAAFSNRWASACGLEFLHKRRICPLEALFDRHRRAPTELTLSAARVKTAAP